MTLDTRSLSLLEEALRELEHGFDALPEFDGEVSANEIARMRAILLEVVERLKDNFPYAHPLYAGQMLKPPHPMARTAYQLAQWINPNNHALDGGRASSAMEKEAVSEIARMFGWKAHLGHLTGGGTMANLEALWVAGRLAPGRTIVASSQAHYTHRRISEVLGLAFDEIPVDARGRMDMLALERRLARGDVSTVVVTLGTTSTGSVDPLPAVLALRERHAFRIHADAAYGGYFTLVDDLAGEARASLPTEARASLPGEARASLAGEARAAVAGEARAGLAVEASAALATEARAAYAALVDVDSLVIDPHKHGLQPYGCGCVLFRDPAVGALYKHESPYTYFSSAELHLGEISLECSRAGAAAVALWATQRLFPLVRGGELALRLGRSHRAARALHAALANDARWRTVFEPELDIVVWAPRAPSASATSKRTQEVFDAAARRGLHLAMARLPRALLAPYWPDIAWDAETVACLRSCLMKPEHLDWIDPIRSILDRIA